MCILALQAQAHEFWISPDAYQVAPGETVTARFRNGEELVGSTLSFIPGRSVRFDVVVGGEARKVMARIGNDPAFEVADLPEGLAIIVHETTDGVVTYTAQDGRSGWERFVAFTEHKAMDGVPEAHLARGLSQEGITERYRRFAKALVAVGNGAGSALEVGLRTEIVAEANPYADDLSGGLPVRVLFEGSPRVGAQVELFERALGDPEGAVSITTYTTDADGRAVLPVRVGHEYLADSVAMLPVEAGGATWQSLWAALTFAVPGA